VALEPAVAHRTRAESPPPLTDVVDGGMGSDGRVSGIVQTH
jgi:hypothetical protein